MYVLKMPVTKLTKDGKKPINAQKGPTCWYYGAQMIREFHNRTYHYRTDSGEDSEKAKSSEKMVSAQRKAETRLYELFRDLGDVPPNAEMERRLKDIFVSLRKSGESGADRSWSNAILVCYGTPPNGKVGNHKLQSLLVAMSREKNFDTLKADQILAGIGFKYLSADVLQDVSLLENALKMYGPLAAGGEYGGSFATSINTRVHLRSGAVDAKYIPTLESGQHAIVICGAGHSDTPSVYYHDPNFPMHRMVMPLDRLRTRIKADSGLGYLPCAGQPCTHTSGEIIYNWI